jgi:ectoine hydroxylase-related dioxygenase (phytanoyl-CoA dioxygenase family)
VLDRAWIDAFEIDGFAILPDALDPALASTLSSAIGAFSGDRRDQGVHRRGDLYGLRNLFENVPETRAVLRAEALRETVTAILGPNAFCVRSLYLDKSPRASWKVPWHQDATIVVKERTETVGFGPWTRKAGLQHVMAPPGTLSAMLTIRLHLDDCDESSGGMKVVRGSHAYGKLPQDSIEQFTGFDVTSCAVPKRGMLAMRPLLLHASGAAVKPGARRVIHLDFSARNLPLPLEWRERHAFASEPSAA